MRPFDQLQNGVWFMTDEKIGTGRSTSPIY